jgi:hypothetical protein
MDIVQDVADATMPMLWTPHRPARPDKSEGGKKFKLVSDYSPAGDQPTAIKELVAGIKEREHDQVLLGVTGSGKTFTMARSSPRPSARPCPGPEQDPRRPALQRDEGLLPGQRRRVLRQLLRLLPAGGLRPAHRHLHREGQLDQRADRPHAPLGHARDPRARRRHRRGLGLLHLRHRLGRDLHGHDLHPRGRPARRREAADRRPRRPAVQAQRRGLRPRHLPPPRRHHRDLPRPLRGPRLARHPVRRRGRGDRRVRHPDRQEDRRPGASASTPTATTSPRARRSTRRSTPSRPSSRSASTG